MIINHKYKFIFIKTRKTAGTSIEIALSQFCGATDIITPIEKIDEATRFESGFCAPQNYNLPLLSYGYPEWKRLIRSRKRMRFSNHVSANFIKRHAGEDIWRTYFKFCFERNPFDKAISRYYWSTRQRSPRPSMDDFLDEVNVRALSNWGIYTLNDHVAVDFVGRYETLNEDLSRIVKKLGLPSEMDLPWAKSQHRENREHYSKILSPHARTRIEQVCAREIATFGYSWEESEGG